MNGLCFSMQNKIVFFITAVCLLNRSSSQTRIDTLNAEAAYLFFVKHDRIATVQKSEEILLLDSLSADAARFIQDIKRPPKEYYLGRLLSYPNVPLYNYLYSRTLRNDKTPDSMRYYLQRSIDLDPKFFWGYVGLASMKAIKQPTAQEALDLLKKAEGIRPNTSYVRNWIAISYLSLERYDESLPLLYAMATDEPTNEMFGYISRAYAGIIKRETMNGIAGENYIRSFCDSVLVRSNKYPQLISSLQTALRKYPECSEQLKRIDQIRLTLSQSKHLDQISPEVQSIIEKVRSSYRSMSSLSKISKTEVRRIMDDKIQTMVTDQVTVIMRPDKSRFESRTKDGKLISLTVSNGEQIVRANPSNKQYIRTSYVDLTDSVNKQSFSSTFATYENYGSSFTGGQLSGQETIEVSGEKIPCFIIKVEVPLPKNSDSLKRYASYSIWIDKSRYVIVKDFTSHFSISSDGKFVELYVSNTATSLRMNDHIPDSHFVFVPPIDWKEVKSFERPRSEILTIGSDAAEFKLTDILGKTHNLKSYQGKVILLDFWATWCGPCLVELPRIENIYKDFKNKGLIVLGINNEQIDVAKKFITEKGYSFPTLNDGENSVSISYKVSAIPTVVIINKEGKIANYIVGVREEQELRKMIIDAGL